MKFDTKEKTIELAIHEDRVARYTTDGNTMLKKIQIKDNELFERLEKLLNNELSKILGEIHEKYPSTSDYTPNNYISS